MTSRSRTWQFASRDDKRETEEQHEAETRQDRQEIEQVTAIRRQTRHQRTLANATTGCLVTSVVCTFRPKKAKDLGAGRCDLGAGGAN
jgi:hypothetical protein